ncbi:MAG: hypothetical protein QXF93_06830 [Saccharolobus sp.]
MVVEGYSKVTTNYVITIPITIRKVYPISVGDIMRVGVDQNSKEPTLKVVKTYERISHNMVRLVERQDNKLTQYESFATVSINYRMILPAKLRQFFPINVGDIVKLIFDENENAIKVTRSEFSQKPF